MSIFGGSSFVSGGGGGAQGVIRYQVLVDSQQATQQVNSFKQSLTSVGSPTANATKNITSFNTSLKQVGTGIAPINQNLNQFNSTMKQTTSQFSAGVTPIKQTGDAMANYQKNLAATNTTQKGIGTQVKDIASKYSTFAIGLGSTVNQVVGLQRQYRDLVDSQIAVDRTTRKLSLAQEALDKATAKVTAAAAKSGKGSVEYANALRDQQQAQAQVKIATDLQGEALEAQGDIYQNFSMQVIPTAITAVGTLGSAFKDLGLKGSTFTGIFKTLKTSAGSIVSTIAGLVTQLFGVGTAGTAAGVGTTAAAGGIKAVDASSKTAAFSVSGLAKALGLIAIPLAGLTFFLELKKVNEDLEKQLNKTSTSIIDSSKKADKGYGDFMKNMRTETKATHDMMSKDVPFVKELGDAVGFVTGMFPGLNEWIVKTSASMDDAVASGDLQNRSLAEIALGIGDVTDAGKKSETQTKAVTDAENKLAEAEKNLVIAQKSHTQHDDAAAAAAVKKAKADLDAAKAGSVTTAQLKDYGKTITVLNPLTGKYTETILDASAAHEGFGKSGGEVEDALKKLGPGYIEVTKNTGEWNNALVAGYEAILQADPVYQSFGATADELAKKFGTLKKAAPIKFPTNDVELYRQGIAAWGSQAVDTTQKQKDLADAAKAMSDTMKADQKVVSDRTAEWLKQTSALDSNVIVNNAHIDSIKKENTALLDEAIALGATGDQLKGLTDIRNKSSDELKDANLYLLDLIATTIDYTKALTDEEENQKLIATGFKDGIVQSKGFFDSLVKGTEQEAQFNAAVAKGAYELGIHSDMLAFSSGKMQELVKTTYEQGQSFNQMAMAAAKGTTFLKDSILVLSQLNAGTLEGIQAANDWTISMIKETAATKSQHEQTVVLAKQMGIMNDLTGKSTDEIQTMMQAAQGDTDAIKKLADAAQAAAKDFASLADAANQRLTTVLKIKIPDADKELKKMIKDLPKEAQKEIKLNLKFAGNAKVMKENFNTLLETAAQATPETATSIAKKMINDLDKGFKKGGGEKAFPGLKAQLEAAIASPDPASALYKILKDYNWDGVGINIPGSIQKDLNGVILNPTIEADTTTGSQLSQDIAKQMQDNPFKVDPLTLFNLGQIDIAKILGFDDKGQTQEITVTANTKPAHTAISALINRIDSIAKMNPAPQLNTKPAHSTLSALINRIDSISKMKPAPQINQKPAQSAISQIINRIDSIKKMNPAFGINQKPAQSAISQVINRIDSISKMKPTVTVKVKYDTSDKPAGVSGTEALPSGTERVSERTDVIGAESTGFVQARGTEALQVNLYNYNNDRETLRTFKRELGRQRYTMGI